MFIISSKRPSGQKLYLGNGRPVVSKKAALKFHTHESAEDRISFWKDLCKKETNLDEGFFSNMFVEEV